MRTIREIYVFATTGCFFKELVSVLKKTSSNRSARGIQILWERGEF